MDWKAIEKEDDFYSIFLPQVGAPEWHGRNLDALADSLVTCNINSIDPPYTIHSINIGSIPVQMVDFQRKVLVIFNECMAENRDIKIVSE